jgi:glycosyltransferase involved in cell wall biosynthesis/ribosomal protein S18 acetylase RimI-like enzyme
MDGQARSFAPRRFRRFALSGPWSDSIPDLLIGISSLLSEADVVGVSRPRGSADGPIRVAHVTTVDLTARFLLLEQLRRLRDEGFEVTSISAPGPWTADLEAEGIRHVPWPHATRSWNLGSDIRAFGELRNIFQRERFDLVHTHNPKPGILGRLAARLAGVPAVINTVHGLYATPEDPPAKRLAVLGLERFAARFSDLELYQSEEDLAWARRIGLVRGSKAILLGNGTDLVRFDPRAVDPWRVAWLRRDLGLPDGATVVGTVGRLVAEKGYRELFEAANRIHARRPEVRFLVVGSPDSEKADAITQAEVARAQKDVVFAGWREDVRDLYALMDVFVLPSWREGVPRSAIEAAAMGRPMVLTDIRGCREVARNGVEGLLVPTRAPGRLADAIERLLEDPGTRERVGRAARARAEKRFDERRVAETVVECSRRVLARTGRLSISPVARVRPARPVDAASMARLHREGLPDSFLPRLGDRFVRRLYRALSSDDDAVALVAVDGDDEVVGFAAGAVSVSGFYRRFRRRHGIAAGLAAGPRLLRRDVLRGLRETASYPDRTAAGPDAELLSIAVAADRGSHGVGRALARGVIEGLAGRGAEEVRVVVAASNERANRFYADIGFRPAGQLAVHDGVSSNVLTVRCRS